MTGVFGRKPHLGAARVSDEVLANAFWRLRCFAGLGGCFIEMCWAIGCEIAGPMLFVGRLCKRRDRTRCCNCGNRRIERFAAIVRVRTPRVGFKARLLAQIVLRHCSTERMLMLRQFHGVNAIQQPDHGLLKRIEQRVGVFLTLPVVRHQALKHAANFVEALPGLNARLYFGKMGGGFVDSGLRNRMNVDRGRRLGAVCHNSGPAIVNGCSMVNVSQFAGDAGKLVFDHFQARQLQMRRLEVIGKLGHVSFDQSNAFDIAVRCHTFKR